MARDAGTVRANAVQQLHCLATRHSYALRCFVDSENNFFSYDVVVENLSATRRWIHQPA